MKMPPFKLYSEERHWFSFNDYGAVLDVMERLQPKRVLEFGPGSSTLALIEGGATHIDTCEDDPVWAATYEERLVAKYPNLVFLHRYTWHDPLSIPSIDDQRYDLALVDGPYETPRRGVVVRYALERCKAVLVPTDGHDSSPLMTLFEDVAHGRGCQFEVMETGPLAGAFALLIWPDEYPPAEDERVIDPAHAQDITLDQFVPALRAYESEPPPPPPNRRRGRKARR